MISATSARVLPIGFSAAMVRALLGGTKTATRRLSSSPLANVRPGDLLWVREEVLIGSSAAPGRIGFRYAADGCVAIADWPDRLARPSPGLRHAFFMPLEFSRIALRVEGVRIERLESITIGEALAEGIVPATGALGFLWDGSDKVFPDARSAFFALWRSIHPAGEANPEVAAIRFRPILRPIREIVPGIGRGGVR